MNVLALFDGHSGGQTALKTMGITPTKYYASEINKYAIQATTAVFPNTIQMGSVTEWRNWDVDFATIDLFIGGSPCQGFSVAGKQAGTTALLNGEKIIVDTRERYLEMKVAGAEFLSQSYLFWEYILCLDHVKQCNPKVKFFLENVKMKKEYLTLISEAIGVEPVFINSALVSAQNRQRFYWCNWGVEQPEDKGVLLADILEVEGVGNIKDKGEWKERETKSQYLDANYYKGVDNHGQRTMIGQSYNRKDGLGKALDKSYPLNASDWRGLNRNQTQTAVVSTERVDTATDIRGHDYNKRISNSQGVCLKNIHYRKLTPRECGRLQTIPEDILDILLSAGISNSQLYKMFGNGWTIDVIAHIFSSMDLPIQVFARQLDLFEGPQHD